MGRRKLNKGRLEIRISQTVLDEVAKRLTLRYNARRQYGAMSSLIEVLLRKWLEAEVQVDPLRPVIVSLDSLLEEMENTQEIQDGQVPSIGTNADGPS